MEPGPEANRRKGRRSVTNRIANLPETRSALPRTYLVAGTLEPSFLANATRWPDALRCVGADVVLTERR